MVPIAEEIVLVAVEPDPWLTVGKIEGVVVAEELEPGEADPRLILDEVEVIPKTEDVVVVSIVEVDPRLILDEVEVIPKTEDVVVVSIVEVDPWLIVDESEVVPIAEEIVVVLEVMEVSGVLIVLEVFVVVVDEEAEGQIILKDIYEI